MAETLKQLNIESKHGVDRVDKKLAEVYSEINTDLSDLKTDVQKFDETVTFDQVVNVLKNAYGKLKGSNFKDVYADMGAGLVMSLQIALKKLDPTAFPTYGIDGMYGKQNSETWNVVKKFQESHGLVPDGWAGLKTMEQILKALGVSDASTIPSQTVATNPVVEQTPVVVEETPVVVEEIKPVVVEEIKPVVVEETPVVIQETKEEVKKEETKKEIIGSWSMQNLKTNRFGLHYALTQLGVTTDAELNQVVDLVPKLDNEKKTQDTLIAFIMSNIESFWGKGFDGLIAELKKGWPANLPVADDVELQNKVDEKLSAAPLSSVSSGVEL